MRFNSARLAALSATAFVALTIPVHAEAITLSAIIAGALSAASGGAASIAGSLVIGVLTINTSSMLTALVRR